MLRTRHIIKIFLVLASLLFAWPALAQPSGEKLPGGDFSELKQTGTGTVLQIISPGLLQLKSGEIIRLSGLHFPDYTVDESGPFALTSVKILADMLQEQPVILYQTRNSAVGRMNRMGHTLAHLVRASDGAWVQGSLLELGLATVRTDQGNAEMATQMLALEEKARKEKLGIWQDLLGILTPGEAEAHIGEFAIVEGRVESVAMKNNRIYLNFGKNWKTDFTVTVSPENRRNFNKGGGNPLDWNRRVLRVRGYLSSLNGPNMEIDHMGAVEFPLESAAKPPINAEPAPKPVRRDNALPLPMRRENKAPDQQNGAKPLPETP